MRDYFLESAGVSMLKYDRTLAETLGNINGGANLDLGASFEKGRRCQGELIKLSFWRWSHRMHKRVAIMAMQQMVQAWGLFYPMRSISPRVEAIAYSAHVRRDDAQDRLAGMFRGTVGETIACKDLAS